MLHFRDRNNLPISANVFQVTCMHITGKIFMGKACLSEMDGMSEEGLLSISLQSKYTLPVLALSMISPHRYVNRLMDTFHTNFIHNLHVWLCPKWSLGPFFPELLKNLASYELKLRHGIQKSKIKEVIPYILMRPIRVKNGYFHDQMAICLDGGCIYELWPMALIHHPSPPPFYRPLTGLTRFNFRLTPNFHWLCLITTHGQDNPQIYWL